MIEHLRNLVGRKIEISTPGKTLRGTLLPIKYNSYIELTPDTTYYSHSIIKTDAIIAIRVLSIDILEDAKLADGDDCEDQAL